MLYVFIYVCIHLICIYVFIDLCISYNVCIYLWVYAYMCLLFNMYVFIDLCCCLLCMYLLMCVYIDVLL